MAKSPHSVDISTPQVARDSTDASTARFVLPAEKFALARLFERVPNARVDIEPAIANAMDHALLVVHTDDTERDAVETSIESDQGVAAVEFLAEREDGWAYRVTWDERPHRFIQCLTAADATILSLRGQTGRWKLRLLTPDRAGIAQAHECMDALGCEAECCSITAIDNGRSDNSALTDEQREALLGAFEAGYYDIPRNVTADELADELGISHQALSERFRRAYRRMVETELAVEASYS
jgi:predicted DNA binding protein